MRSFKTLLLATIAMSASLVGATGAGAGQQDAPPPPMVLISAKAALAGKFFAQATAVAKCPGGYGLVSGGGWIIGNSFAHIDTMSEDLERGQFTVIAVQPPLVIGIPAPADADVRAFAICGRAGVALTPAGQEGALPSLVSIAETEQIPGKFFGVAVDEAYCPKGWNFVSGGAKVEGTKFAQVVQSYPRADLQGWRGAAIQPNFMVGTAAPAPGKLLVSVVCARVRNPITPVKPDAAPAPAPPLTIKVIDVESNIPDEWAGGGSAIAKCPAGFSLISGGGRIYETAYAHLYASYPNLKNDSWYVEARNSAYGAGVPRPQAGKVVAFAVCSKTGKAAYPLPH